MTSLNLDYAENTYIAVTLIPGSTYVHDPAILAGVHPSITHVGQLGALADVQLFSVPNQDWARVGDDVLRALNGSSGIARVDVQVTRTRTKRDEL